MPSPIKPLREQAFDRQQGRCCYCAVSMWLNTPTELHVPAVPPHACRRLQCTAEHLIARSCGGANRSDNIAAACRLLQPYEAPPQEATNTGRISRQRDASRAAGHMAPEVGLRSGPAAI